MKAFPLLLCAALALFCQLASAHGVERGSVHKAIRDLGFSDRLGEQLDREIQERCDLRNVTEVSASTKIISEEGNQKLADFSMLITLRFRSEEGIDATATLNAAEFSLSESAEKAPTIRSLKSQLCR